MGLVSCGQSAAQRRFRQSGLLMAGGLVVLCAGLSLYEWHHTPTGPVVYGLAVLPSLLITGMIVNVGRYLREEKDEFERDQTVRSLLWGTGAVMAVSTYLGFLRLFGWTGHEPFLLELSVFCWSAVIARGNYRRANKALHDEEPAA